MLSSDLVITYLANIIRISQLDGALAPKEQEAVEKICREHKAEKQQLAEAVKMVAEGDYTLTPVGRFSDRIRNLEDMLLVAMSDGDFSVVEKDEMLDFVRRIGITKEQVKTILTETKLKINLQQTSLKCPQCAAVLTPDSKFCTACGCKVVN